MKEDNSVIDAIRARRSVRQFRDEPVSDEIVNQIIEAGLWAPSGINNQPWKFAVIRDPDLKDALSAMTRYASIIQGAPVCIAVFLDHRRVYDRTKDVQSAGACLQNMLLAIHSMGLGGVWLGEILKNKEKVAERLGAGEALELMAVVALGYPGRASADSSPEDGPGRDRIEEHVFLRK